MGGTKDKNQKSGKPGADKPKSKPLPEANVDPDGHCTLTATPEHVRPDTGAPCLDGRDGGK